MPRNPRRAYGRPELLCRPCRDCGQRPDEHGLICHVFGCSRSAARAVLTIDYSELQVQARAARSRRCRPVKRAGGK